MKHAFRMVLLVLLFAALPLRGYAGALMGPCESHLGGVTATPEHVHDEGSHHGNSGDGDESPPHGASVCSICASCCASAGLVQDAALVALPQAAGSGRIAFLDRRSSGFVPGNLDRPPLAH